MSTRRGQYTTLVDEMDLMLKNALKTSSLKATGTLTAGCINEGEAFFTDSGTVFMKWNRRSKTRQMFDGEWEGLKAIAATQTLRVPKPILIMDGPVSGAVMVLEYIDMKSVREFSGKLGEQLAKMHLHNLQANKNRQSGYVGKEEGHSPVEQFGFHVPTSCGYTALENTWCDDWPTFFARHRLDGLVRLVEENYGDRFVGELWADLQFRISSLFQDIEIFPSLLHGDLWNGNVGETVDGPVVYDPAVLYGHHEFELSISDLFGGFYNPFYRNYHKAIPRAPGFDNRKDLYQLFHYLNHWNHFGTTYRDKSITLMQRLLSL